MHKLVIGTLVVAALSGCAGSKMKDARAGQPYKTLASDKATLVVAQCIQFGWQDEAVFGVDAGASRSRLRRVGLPSTPPAAITLSTCASLAQAPA